MTARYGRASQTDPESDMLREAWERASLLEPTPSGGEWVPWESIRVREDVLPRERQDEDAIEQYAGMIDELPPIVVQRDTFVLIEGKHRLFAAPKALRDHVRIVELDVPDDELWERAFEENAAHGVRLTSRERTRAARRYLAAHPDLSDGAIAKWAGVDRITVLRWRHSGEQRQVDEDQPVALQQVDPPPVQTRTGTDGRTRAVPPPAPRPPSYGAGGSPPPRPQSPAQTVRVINFGELRQESPRELARSVPEEQVEDQMREGRAMRRWLDDYIDELAERAATPV